MLEEGGSQESSKTDEQDKDDVENEDYEKEVDVEKEIDKEINKVESDKTKKKIKQQTPHSSKSASSLMDVGIHSAFSLEIPRYSVDNDRQSIFKNRNNIINRISCIIPPKLKWMIEND